MSTATPKDEEQEYSSVILGHCVKVYKAMAETAEHGPQGFVFTGRLVQLFEDIGIGQPYYTAITRKLQDMDCIRQIQRGASSKPSKWMLLQEPTEELFAIRLERARRPAQQRGKLMFEQQLRDVNTRLLKLEAWARTQGYQG